MTQIKVKLNPDVQPNGSDLAVVNAARRSFNTRSTWESKPKRIETVGGDGPWHVDQCLSSKDKKLIEFLARGISTKDFDDFCLSIENSVWEDLPRSDLIEKLWQWRNTPTHDTPFNHCHISFEVQAPIFVARQLVKHEYLVFSEFSRRYITDDVEFYQPIWRKAPENKKQGSGDELEGVAQGYINGLNTTHQTALSHYKWLIEDMGVAPEQARMVLPQSLMTSWTWSGTLGAFAKMCRERLHPDAQEESRQVAEQIYEYLKKYYPVSSEALVEGI